MAKKTCMESALDCISRRAFAVKELAGKLKDKKFHGREIADAINRLEEMGYLNDMDFSQSCIRSNLYRWGKKRIEQDLYNRGVARDTVEDAFFAYQEKEGEDVYNWSEKATNILLKRFGKWQEVGSDDGFVDKSEKYKTQQKEKNRRLRFLVSRGYSMEEALYALEHSKS
jgi:regulatory protein